LKICLRPSLAVGCRRGYRQRQAHAEQLDLPSTANDPPHTAFRPVLHNPLNHDRLTQMPALCRVRAPQPAAIDNAGCRILITTEFRYLFLILVCRRGGAIL
jgi:hypothetical protein